MSIHRLIYCSAAANLSQDDITAILNSSDRNNAPAGITGMLLFNAGNFLQLLEGTREQTTQTFCRIANDPRHNRIELLSAASVPRRLFPEWSMHYIARNGTMGRLLKRYQCQADFLPHEMSCASAEDFCKDCSKLLELEDFGV